MYITDINSREQARECLDYTTLIIGS